jgi:hypothetical protein
LEIYKDGSEKEAFVVVSPDAHPYCDIKVRSYDLLQHLLLNHFFDIGNRIGIGAAAYWSRSTIGLNISRLIQYHFSLNKTGGKTREPCCFTDCRSERDRGGGGGAANTSQRDLPSTKGRGDLERDCCREIQSIRLHSNIFSCGTQVTTSGCLVDPKAALRALGVLSHIYACNAESSDQSRPYKIALTYSS